MTRLEQRLVDCPKELMLLRYLDDRLTDSAAVRLNEHVVSCLDCQQQLELLTGKPTWEQALDGAHSGNAAPLVKTADPMSSDCESRRADGFETLGQSSERAKDIPDKREEGIHSDEITAAQGHSRQFGRFRLKRLLGRGGFGVVYLARDELINRYVALKLPLAAAFSNPHVRRRFLREGEAAGRLQHPNIVPVYEVGQIDQTCFVSSAYCVGPSLREWLQQQAAPTPPSRAAKIVLALAEAVQHAHERDVLHRDIKPGNIMLDFSLTKANAASDLPFVPRLTDFGLAKTLDSDVEGTATGAGIIMGTPRYLAPEQAAGLMDQVGPPSDVYALGTVLYELLTSRPVVDGDNNAVTLTRVIAHEPASPRRLVHSIPRDLEAICLKCLEKKPQSRYGSAQLLVEDLRRFLRGESTQARPMGRIGRLGKWANRNRTLAALLSVTFLSLTVLGAMGWWSATILNDSLKTTRELLYAADLRLAEEALASGNGGRAEELLRRHIPQAPEVDRRGFAWHFLWNRIHNERLVLRATPGVSMWSHALSPNGAWCAGGDDRGGIWIWNTRSGERIAHLQGHANAIRSLHFSPDGHGLVSVGKDECVSLWNCDTWHRVRTFRPHEGMVYRARYSPLGDCLATCGADRRIRIWDTSTWNQKLELTGHSDRVYDVAYSHDGRLLVSAGEDRSVYLWDSATGRPIQHFTDSIPGNRRYECVAISPDEQQLAAGSNLGDVIVWNASSPEPTRIRSEHASNVFGLAFSPSGDRLASASKDSTVRLSSLGHEDHVEVFYGHGTTVYDVLISCNGNFLSTCGKDGSVRLWNLSDHAYTQQDIPRHRASGGLAGETNIVVSDWALRPYLPKCDLQLPALCLGWLQSYSFSQNDRLMASAGQFYSGLEGGLIRNPRDPVLIQCDVDADGDLDQLASFGPFDELVWMEREPSGGLRPPRLLDPDYSLDQMRGRQVMIWNMANGKSHVLSSSFSEVHVCPDPAGGNQLRTLVTLLPRPAGVWPHDFDQDGDEDLLITTFDDQTVAWYEDAGDLTFSASHVIAQGIAAYQAIACTPRGDAPATITALDDEGTLHQFIQAENDPRADWESAVIDSRLALPSSMGFHDMDRDGELDLLVASRTAIVWYRNRGGRFVGPARKLLTFGDGSWVRSLPHNVALWDLAEPRLRTSFNAYTTAVSALACAPDGSTLAVAGHNNVIRLWDPYSGSVVKTFPKLDDGKRIGQLVYSPDGTSLFGTVGDEVYVWKVDQQNETPRRLIGHSNSVEFIATSPKQHVIATTSHDQSVRIWDLRLGQTQQTLVGHTQRPVAAAFAPDGRLLASAGEHGELIVWDVATGQLLLTLNDLKCSTIAAVHFTDDNHLTAAGNVRTDENHQQLCIGTWRTRHP